MDNSTVAAEKLHKWIVANNFSGWDPFDALNSPLINWMIGQNRFLGQVAVQLVKRSPVNYRPLLGIKKGRNPKGMGLLLEYYADTVTTFSGRAQILRLEEFTQWLLQNASPGYSGYCWGYNFDWPNRNFFARAGVPTIINSSFIGLAFLKIQDLIDKESKLLEYVPTLGDQKGLKIARSICDYILKDLDIHHFSENSLSFSYTPVDKRYIHNANLLGAWLLSEVYKFTGEPVLADHALAAARYSAGCQLPDGSWWYGEDEREHWVDNFHTGYVLEALKHISKNLKTNEFDGGIQRGYLYWKRVFIGGDGAPVYYPGKKYPVDIHSVSQSIITFLEFADSDPEGYKKAEQVANWAIANMQNKDGSFGYQITRFYKNSIPYMRWGQTWMLIALDKLNSYKQ